MPRGFPCGRDTTLYVGYEPCNSCCTKAGLSVKQRIPTSGITNFPFEPSTSSVPGAVGASLWTSETGFSMVRYRPKFTVSSHETSLGEVAVFPFEDGRSVIACCA
jgi:hypothetical protein